MAVWIFHTPSDQVGYRKVSIHEPDPTLHLVPLSDGSEIPLIEHDGAPHVLLGQAITQIGLDVETQMRLLRRQPWAQLDYAYPAAADGRRRRAVVCTVPVFLMWLATLDSGKVAEHVRTVLAAFQCETRDVVTAYWLRGVAVNPRGRTPGQVELIETAAAGLVGPVLEHLNRAHFAQQVVDGRRDETPEMSKPVARRRVGQHLARAYAAAVDAGLDARAALAEGATT